ncbi:MAG: M23 family metallopeptidase [Kofleriaceae bacterium]
MRSAPLALVAASLGLAHAGPAPTATPAPTLTDQLDAQAATVAKARDQVASKRDDRHAARTQRVRLAYKLLRGATSPLTVAPSERLGVARSRATARLLLARDRAEEALLADELGSLDQAAARIARDRDRAESPPVDLRLIRPVAGPIARRFGILVHDSTKAVLSRRGLDFEVDAEASVVAPADGIVRYAGPIRGLDQGVVVDCGGVWTVVAKLDPPVVATGDHVEAGQALGRAHRYRVYLEVRVPVGPGGLPIDPEPYLVRK